MATCSKEANGAHHRAGRGKVERVGECCVRNIAGLAIAVGDSRMTKNKTDKNTPAAESQQHHRERKDERMSAEGSINSVSCKPHVLFDGRCPTPMQTRNWLASICVVHRIQSASPCQGGGGFFRKCITY